MPLGSPSPARELRPLGIGLPMFFDRETAQRSLADPKARLFPGGAMIVNMLVEGTTCMDMFDAESHRLFARETRPGSFAGWDPIWSEFGDFGAPGGLQKSFSTVVARELRR
jgi:hypothetical protein